MIFLSPLIVNVDPLTLFKILNVPTFGAEMSKRKLINTTK